MQHKKPNNNQQKENDIDSSEYILGKAGGEKSESIIEMMVGMGSISGNPLHHKMNEKHIDKLIDLASNQFDKSYDLEKRSQEFEHSDIQSTQKYTFWSFSLCIAILIFILIWFKDKPEILVPVLTGLAGLIGGYGYGKSGK